MPLPSAQQPRVRLPLTRIVPSRQAGASFDANPTTSLLDSLARYYKLDEAASPSLDSTGRGGSLAWLAGAGAPASAAGIIGNAINLTAASQQYLQEASSADTAIGGNQPFTLQCWFKGADVTTYKELANKTAGTANANYEYSIFVQTGRVHLFMSDGGVNSVDLTGPTVTANAWHHALAWYDPTAQTVYCQVDGGAVASTAWTHGTKAGTAPFWIGRVGATYWNGLIDEVALWKRVLTGAERATLYAGGSGLTYPFSPRVYVSAPVSYQVINRSGGGANGSPVIVGSVDNISGDLEARLNGGNWAPLASGVTGPYSASVSFPGGQGLLEVRLTARHDLIGSMPLVGVGEVFCICGQSNASGRGTNLQSYSHASLKATQLDNRYAWAEAVDPLDDPTNQTDLVSRDNPLGPGSGVGGTYWLPMATLAMASLGVPVSFIPCAKGATLIAQWAPGANHQDRTTLFGSMVYRILQAQRQGGTVRAALWHQGEGDQDAATTQAEYTAGLIAIADTLFSETGVKLMPCKLQTMNDGTTLAGQAKIRAAIADAWAAGGNILTGPDLVGITPSVDGVHLRTDGELATGAALWWAALQAAFGW